MTDPEFYTLKPVGRCWEVYRWSEVDGESVKTRITVVFSYRMATRCVSTGGLLGYVRGCHGYRLEGMLLKDEFGIELTEEAKAARRVAEVRAKNFVRGLARVGGKIPHKWTGHEPPEEKTEPVPVTRQQRRAPKKSRSKRGRK